MRRSFTPVSRMFTATLAILLAILTTPTRAPAQAPAASSPSEPDVQAQTATDQVPHVQLAILLDSSSSMGGLIGQAQTQIWKIVNEFALAKQRGKPVALQVALYEYGKNTLPAESRYIRKIVPLSDDLDKVSEELFALKANTISGGDEWCGAVIQAAVNELSWSAANNDLKVIVIAGNEPFTNGPVDYREACKHAITKGILVDTIHCGNAQTGIAQGWADGARLAEGKYMSIDQNRRVATLAAPQDAEIIRLGKELNSTYVPYGALGSRGLRRQDEQDRNLEDKGRDVNVERAITKSGRYYKNSTWDLVDAFKEGKVELAKLKKEELPEQLRQLSLEDQKSYLKKQGERRKEIQAQIETLTAKRKEHVTRLRAARPASGATPADATLDQAVIESLREKAEKKNIELDGKPEPQKTEPQKTEPAKNGKSPETQEPVEQLPKSARDENRERSGD